MRRLLLLLAAGAFVGCASPLPAVDPQMAWVDFATPSPGGKLLMADRLDNQRLSDGRYFQVTPGSHELRVRFDFEVMGGGSGLMSAPLERLCYLTINYDHFEAGQRYLLEARSIAFTPSARLYNAKREIVAEDRLANCVM
ncbi:PA0061/PA0062 family lipoprotein [Pseudomonas lini]